MNLSKSKVIFIFILLITIWLGYESGLRRGLLFIIAVGLGFSLYHASFGFSAAWRRFTADFDGRGLRAQMLLLAIVACVAFPMISGGDVFGRNVSGFILPVGTSVIVGAFIFGVGMQLGGGCGSGTLFTVGGGNTRMILTLFGFIVGSVIATSHVHVWHEMPGIGPVSLIKKWGWQLALMANLTIFAVIVWFTLVLEKRRHKKLLPQTRFSSTWSIRLLRGPWSLTSGACALAVLSILVLVSAGRPWGITSAFALWGAKIAMLIGIDVTQWPYWSGWRSASLQKSVWSDVTSMMNFGVIFGALLASSLAGKFCPHFKISHSAIVSAILGGVLLGYGARLAFGCNIGAYFGGIISGSLHGWIWMVAGFSGSYVGTRLRPMFGLTVEKVEL